MIVTGSQIRRMGWMAVLAACITLFAVLSFNVHAVRSEVLLAERQIIALERETLMLETEFQARASQRQLAEWNAVEFGYQAPRADQFLDNERQLASLGQPLGPSAPAPIRLARADVSETESAQAEMVSPVSGEPVTFASANVAEDAGSVLSEAFGDFLIEASPIRAANAQTPQAADAVSAVASEAVRLTGERE